MKEQTFIIRGIPRAQGRPKFYRRGNFVGAYDPKESRQYKDNVAAQIVAQSPRYIADAAIDLSVWFDLPRPKTLPKRVTEHTKKPDLDNLVKGVKDALKGLVWRDDSQVVRITAVKQYGHEPGVQIIVKEV